MALKVIVLRKKVNIKKAQLEELRNKDAAFEKREKELEVAIDEVDDKTPDADKTSLDEEVDKFQDEFVAHNEEKEKLEEEIEKLEKELKDTEGAQPKAPTPSALEEEQKERGKGMQMENRTKFFGLSLEERNALFEDEAVKTFIQEIRTTIKNKRAINGEGLTIPMNFLPMIKTVTETVSKLLKYTNFSPLTGEGRAIVMGTIPEGIWTEQCGELNELEIGFNDVEVDGFKVGGFFKVHNSILEDNNIGLAMELIKALGIAIAKACDKAIVYGTGVKMPLGFVTRLTQTTEPEGYPITARKWIDLHDTNIKKIENKKGIELFKEITLSLKMIYNDYDSNNLVWIMNKNTHTDITVESMGTNINATIVAGIDGSKMPVVGGSIEELEFMADGDIAFGYGSCYKMVERKGTTIGQSEHVRFVQDQTVFKGTARYDGKPVIAESFGLINIDGKEPTTSVIFAPDKANEKDAQLTSLKIGSTSLFPTFKPDAYEYVTNTSNASNKIEATVYKKGAIVEIMNGSTKLNNGDTATWVEGENIVKITISFAGVSKEYSVKVTKTPQL